MASNRKSREQKKRKKAAGRDKLIRRHWAPFEAILKAFRLPPRAVQVLRDRRAYVLSNRIPRPEVALDASAVGIPGADLVRSEVERAFATIRLDDCDLVAADVLSAGCTVDLMVDILAASKDEPQIAALFAPLVEQTRGLQGAWMRKLSETVGRELAWIAACQSRIDRGFFWVTSGYEDSPRRPGLQVRVHWAPHQQEQVIVEGQARPAWRSGRGTARGVRWATWGREVLGLGGGLEHYPVYVQSHAIEQLEARVPIQPTDRIHASMLISLDQPVVVERRGGTFLVEYRLLGPRLGYFVAEVARDVVVVRTFLFLTMAGTPEAKLLHEKLRLLRPDIEHLGLDTLERFFLTDIRTDPQVVQVLSECGCGHLLTLFTVSVAEGEFCLKPGVARAFRDYIGLPAEQGL